MEALLFDRMLQVLSALNRCSVRYKLFGGLAMNLHGVLRATEDMDLFVEATEANVSRLHSALRSVWNDPCIDEITYEDLAGDYPAVVYGPPDETFTIDILTRLGEMYDYANVESQEVRIHDVPIQVATPLMLYRMKRGTVRPQDHVDAARLLQKFHLEAES